MTWRALSISPYLGVVTVAGLEFESAERADERGASKHTAREP